MEKTRRKPGPREGQRVDHRKSQFLLSHRGICDVVAYKAKGKVM